MAATFEVTGIRKTVNLTPGSDRRPVYEVTFTTKPHNIEGSVLVPVDEFTPDTVRAAAADQAALLETVMEL